MESYKLNVVSQTLTVSAKFAEKMTDIESVEFALYEKLRVAFPRLTVKARTHKTPSGYKTKSGEEFKRNQYKDLTYERMERFMGVLTDTEKYLREYYIVKEFAAASRRNGYSIVRDWFLAQFPEFRKYPMAYIRFSPEVVPGSDFVEPVADGEEEKAA